MARPSRRSSRSVEPEQRDRHREGALCLSMDTSSPARHRNNLAGYPADNASAASMRIATRRKSPATTKKVLSAPFDVLLRDPLFCRRLSLRLLGVQRL